MGMLAGARLAIGSWLVRAGIRVMGEEVVGDVAPDVGDVAPDEGDVPVPVVVGERGLELLRDGFATRPARAEEPPEAPLEGSLEHRRAALRGGGR